MLNFGGKASDPNPWAARMSGDRQILVRRN